jgi:hypothetical protein
MQEESIGELRGVADNDQNLEGNMAAIAEEKMGELPGAERYKKASGDMKRLTAIEKKTKKGEILTRDDLIFLYEINSPIEGFGYHDDPRIKELRDQRNPKADAPIVFECQPDQIASKREDVNENTKAYIGKLESGIFDVIKKYNIEHLYTSFPEGKIRHENIEIGGYTSEALEKKLREKGIKISDYAEYMLRSKEFTTLKNQEQIGIVRLKVRDLGFESGATKDEIYKRAEKLGLEFCPAEVGPNLRLKYTNQPLNEWFSIAMKQIAGRYGVPYIFTLAHREDGLWLSIVWANPDYEWDAGSGFAFSLRKENFET